MFIAFSGNLKNRWGLSKTFHKIDCRQFIVVNLPSQAPGDNQCRLALDFAGASV
jgi:hypothetical protein